MAKRNPKVTEKLQTAFSGRIKEFAGEIHRYGIEKLYTELKGRGYITASYPFETFKTDFKRMKQNGNGLLNEPALISGILEITSFPANALFGGPITNTENNLKILENAVVKGFEAAEEKKKKQKTWIPSTSDYEIAICIRDTIKGIMNNYITDVPIFYLFLRPYKQKLTLRKVKNQKIDRIIEKLFNTEGGYAYNTYLNIPTSEFLQHSLESMINRFWNYTLAIVYCMYSVERMYRLYKFGRTIRWKKDLPYITYSFKLDNSDAIVNKKGDIFSIELKNISMLLDDLIGIKKLDEASINRDFSLHKAIICNFNYILNYLINPEIEPSPSMGAFSHLENNQNPIVRKEYKLMITSEVIDALLNIKQSLKQLVDFYCDSMIKETEEQGGLLKMEGNIPDCPSPNPIPSQERKQPELNEGWSLPIDLAEQDKMIEEELLNNEGLNNNPISTK
jgi:hypothetical protein